MTETRAKTSSTACKKPVTKKPVNKATGASPRPKKGPLMLPCGCNSIGHRCPSEEHLGSALDAALAAFRASGQKPGQDGFPNAYRPLLKARRAYHEHFRLVYDPASDPLLQEHRCLQQGNPEPSHPERISL